MTARHAGRCRRPRRRVVARRAGALAFDRDGQIWVAYPDGTHARRLASGFEPRYSPDGRRIGFIGDRTAYVIGRDGHHQRQVVDELDLLDFDPGFADDAHAEWLGWQPLSR
jgi:hypothetical protein